MRIWRDALYDTLCVVVKFFSTAAPSIFFSWVVTPILLRPLCWIGAIDLANDPLRTTATKKRVSPERRLERRPLWHTVCGSKVSFPQLLQASFIFVVTPILLRSFVEYIRFTAHSIPSKRAYGRRWRVAFDLANDPLRTAATKKRGSSN